MARSRKLWWTLLAFLLVLAASESAAALQPITRKQELAIFPNEAFVVRSDQQSIQQVFIHGNISSANLPNSTYPAKEFRIAALSPGRYELRIQLDFPTAYAVTTFVESLGDRTVRNSTSYYITGGPMELEIRISSVEEDTGDRVDRQISPWDSFVGWTTKFGQAFPLWVKVLYLLLGVQFFAVGGLWIRRETSRREFGAQRFDNGNIAYLWVDLAYKFLTVCFITLVVIMGGQLLILFILRFMFLAPLELLSLWDLFVVGFAAGAVILAYFARFALEKFFDLKPLEDE